jgi:hypothetical protein
MARPIISLGPTVAPLGVHVVVSVVTSWEDPKGIQVAGQRRRDCAPQVERRSGGPQWERRSGGPQVERRSGAPHPSAQGKSARGNWVAGVVPPAWQAGSW